MVPEQSNSDGHPPHAGLVAACRHGDERAWEQLVRGHAGLVYMVIRRSGLAGHDADDLFHDVWIAAWEQLDTLSDERRFDTWLVTLAVRQVRRALARRRPA